VGTVLTGGFLALMITGIVEKKRFEPFYKDVLCPESSVALAMPLFSLPPAMVPPGGQVGTPPFGLYGNIMNTTSSCSNPNQVKIITKQADYKGTLYLPELSNWSWGASEKSLFAGKVNGSYLSVASITLTQDYILPAAGSATAHSKTVAAAPLQNFMGVFAAGHLTGYVPLYTKSEAKAESCVKLFGIEMCEKKNSVTWCGVLGGNCQTQFEMAGMQMWVPGLCSYTKTICRMDSQGGDKAEAEMKALVTAKQLGVMTIDMPCMKHTGYPATMNCPLPSAPGVNQTLHQRDIAGFVDGPYPDQSELEDAESMILMVTSLAIALGAVGCLTSALATVCIVCRLRAGTVKASEGAASVQGPVILASTACEKTSDVSV